MEGGLMYRIQDILFIAIGLFMLIGYAQDSIRRKIKERHTRRDIK